MNASRKRPGSLFTLVAPAGAGKNTLMKNVIARTHLRQLPTATTRPIRHYEQHGREHLFVTDAEFQQMLDDGALLEHEVIHGKLYGMPRADVEAALDAGDAIIADIGMKGDANARAAYPDNIISIFIQPPSIGSLIERMRERGEHDDEIGRRLLRVPAELAYAPACDYLILNDVFDRAADKLLQIVTAELRGAHQAVRSDTRIDFRFRYTAQMIPTFEDMALRSKAGLPEPEAEIGSGELPHEAALCALRRELALDLSEDAVIGGDKQDGEYLPPIKLLYTKDASGERVTYRYYCRLDARIDAPAGWSWVELPEAFDAALPEQRGEV